MFNIFELLYKLFTNNKDESVYISEIKPEEPVKVKKVRKPRKKKVEK